MKKLFCFLILTAILSTSLIGCGNNNETTSDNASGTTSEGTSYKDDKGKYISKLPYQDFSGKEFKIIVRGQKFETYQSEDFTTESTLYGDLLNDAVRERNNYIEEKYKVKLTVIKSDTINEDVRNEAAAGSGAYDAVMPSIPVLASEAQSGILYDMKSLKNIDMDAPWWDKNATKAFSIDNKVYFSTGDITILNKVCTPSILFNKEMLSKNGLENPYQLVKDKKWTFDKLAEMAKAVTAINSMDQKTSNQNIFGMLTGQGDAQTFYGGSGETLCGKDSNDLPYITIGGERSVNVAQKVLKTLQDANWCVFAEDFENPIWVNSFKTFLEGRALFRPSGFSATTKARQQSDVNFGILPVPMFDESQSNYFSYCDTGEVVGIAIPKSCNDPEFSAYMVEIYAAAAKNYITPAYYEVNLKTKDARDDESVEMLDIIFNNIVYDVGEVYNFGTLGSMLTTMMKDKNTEIASKLETIKETAQSDIDKTVSTYESENQ